MKKKRSKIVPKWMHNLTASWHRLFIDFGWFWASLLGPFSALFRKKWSDTNCPFCVRGPLRRSWANRVPPTPSQAQFWLQKPPQSHQNGAQIAPICPLMPWFCDTKTTKILTWRVHRMAGGVPRVAHRIFPYDFHVFHMISIWFLYFGARLLGLAVQPSLPRPGPARALKNSWADKKL